MAASQSEALAINKARMILCTREIAERCVETFMAFSPIAEAHCD